MVRIAELLDETTDRLRGALGDDLLAVALFGSRARDDARPDSDVDLYVVALGLPQDPFGRAEVMARAQVSQVELAVSILARTPEEFSRDITPLQLDLALDARVLFERDAWLSTRLATVRHRIEEAGLERGADGVWRWRVAPRTFDWAVGWDGVHGVGP